MSASFALLYSLEEINSPELSVKVIGHQWYWSYEISHIIHLNGFRSHGPNGVVYNVEFDSYITQDDDLQPRQLRLLQVDRFLLLPAFTQIRLNFTGADVIHSWAVPSFGIKTDCIPGRLNQTPLYITVKDIFVYGQCSELCGINHGFIPITVLVF